MFGLREIATVGMEEQADWVQRERETEADRGRERGETNALLNGIISQRKGAQTAAVNKIILAQLDAFIFLRNHGALFAKTSTFYYKLKSRIGFPPPLS